MRLAQHGETFRCEKARASPADGAHCRWRIAHCEARGTGETITARRVCDRLDVTEIKLPVTVASQEGLALRFDRSGGFQLSVEETKSVVIGRAAVTESSDLSIIELSPVQPRWARGRAVRIACSREGNSFKFASTIGSSTQARGAADHRTDRPQRRCREFFRAGISKRPLNRSKFP